jgi:hypothetical protein
MALSLFDELGSNIEFNGLSSPIELKIPRDSNLLLPLMTLQNVTGMKMSATSANNNRQFNLYYINVTSVNENVTLSATFELKPSNDSIAYMLIVRFDGIPILNSSMNQTDGSRILCPTGT